MDPLRRSLLAASVATLAGCAAAQPEPAARAGKVRIQWFGQSAFKMTTVAGKVIVVDPWFTANPQTPAAYKKLEALGKVDLILVTHGHGDHYLDAPALAKMNDAPVWAPAGLAQSMQTLGVLPVAQANRLNKGGVIQPFPGVKVTMTHAEHSSELLWRNPATGKDETHVGGEPCGYVIEFENGFRLWHLGDTGLFGDMKFLAERYKPELLLVPIGGGRNVMDPVDAAYATRELIKPKAAFPMHYGTNPSLVGTPAEFAQAMQGSPIRVVSMQPGDTQEF